MDRQTLRLKPNHKWKSKPGYSICVIDRGAIRFDYPSDWIVKHEDGSIHLHDQEPGVESCDLGVSIFRMPIEVIADLNLEEMLHETLAEDRKPYEQSELRHIDRSGMQIVWVEQKYLDKEYKRDARFRVALARESTICLISMNYWAARADALEPVWDEILASLVMGLPIGDPTMGPVIQ